MFTKNKSLTFSLFLFYLSFILLTACSNENTPTNSETIVDTLPTHSVDSTTHYDIDQADDNQAPFAITLENANYYYSNQMSYIDGINFDIIANEELDLDDFHIIFDGTTAYTVDVHEQEIIGMTYDDYLISIDFDWQEAGRLAQIVKENGKKENRDNFNSFYYAHQDDFEEKDFTAYEASTFHYTCHILFSLSAVDSILELNEIHIRYQDIDYVFDIGSIVLDAKEPHLTQGTDNPAVMRGIAASNKPILPNENKLIYVSETTLEVFKDMTIQSVAKLHQDFNIEEVIVVSNNQGQSSQHKLGTDQELKIESGAFIQPIVGFKYNGLSESLFNSLNAAFILNYSDVEGNTYEALISSSYRTRLSSMELRLAKLDNKEQNVFDYYYYFQKWFFDIPLYDIHV